MVLCYNCFCCFEHPAPRFPFKYLCKSHILRFNLIYQFGQSAIVKYHRLGDFLTMRNVPAASSGSQKFKIKVFAGVLSSWLADGHLLTSSQSLYFVYTSALGLYTFGVSLYPSLPI